MKIFDLEQQIMQCWNVVDDVKLITEWFADSPEWKDMDGTLQDAIMNKYFGIAELYQIKFEKLFSTFEDVSSEYHSARRGVENKASYPTLDELDRFYGADE